MEGGLRVSSQAWWPLALSEEAGKRPLAARVGEQEIVLFRDRSGHARAAEDRCPHRRAPLSMGRVTEEGTLQCGYHGWCFEGEDGRCVAIPNYRPGERIPPRFGVIAFPTEEQYGFVFVWTSGAPPAGAIRPLPEIGSMGSHPLRGRATLPVAHQTLVERLLHDPMATLGLGGISAGSAHGALEVRKESVVIERHVTLAPIFKGQAWLGPHAEIVLRAETWAVTGLTELTVDGGVRGPLARVVIAPVPAAGGGTELRWQCAWTGPMPQVARLVLGALGRRAFNPNRALWLGREPMAKAREGDAVTTWRTLTAAHVTVPVASNTQVDTAGAVN
jgi:nitrite reductase/ring-hydroxylating ferredoxin subunit